jgi:hypothetical protein
VCLIAWGVVSEIANGGNTTLIIRGEGELNSKQLGFNKLVSKGIGAGLDMRLPNMGANVNGYCTTDGRSINIKFTKGDVCEYVPIKTQILDEHGISTYLKTSPKSYILELSGLGKGL